ncbi:MAG: hypothetical protein D3908_00795 [Candidatus Electrothrix sp. AUS4]|nr:hypothetical protein [Candidatus Electrothrix sp. AUS4]
MLSGASEKASDPPIFIGITVGMDSFDGFLIEIMSFFDKKDNRRLEKGRCDFFLTFVKQQIIK